MQTRLLAENAMSAPVPAALAPDGDAEVEEQLTQTLRIPACEACGGVLKPHVVFFGGAVAKPIVAQINQQLGLVDALLVVGSSLTVFSSFRFCRQAHQQGLPVAAINQGKTRADDLLTLKLNADCGALLSGLALP